MDACNDLTLLAMRSILGVTILLSVLAVCAIITTVRSWRKGDG